MSLGLYLHLPFCRVHCTYCPFAISTNLALEDSYTDALVREIEAAAPALLETVYFGGGTPSRLSAANLDRIFLAIRQKFTIAGDAEVSVEANPEDVNPEAVAHWRALGVHRVSIGVQSFHDDELRVIGRVH